MNDPQSLDLELQREMAVDRYVQAYDRGDLDGIDEVFAQAVDDPELDRRIIGINAALHAEAGLQPIDEQAQFVRRLLFRYVSSGIPHTDEETQPVTVMVVAAQLEVDHAKGRPMPVSDVKANQKLLTSTIPIPVPVTSDIVERLAEELHVTASDRYWEMFRRAAVILVMARQRAQTQRTAARRQSSSGQSRQKNTVRHQAPHAKDES